jgi:hypothetical protein
MQKCGLKYVIATFENHPGFTSKSRGSLATPSGVGCTLNVGFGGYGRVSENWTLSGSACCWCNYEVYSLKLLYLVTFLA